MNLPNAWRYILDEKYQSKMIKVPSRNGRLHINAIIGKAAFADDQLCLDEESNRKISHHIFFKDGQYICTLRNVQDVPICEHLMDMKDVKFNGKRMFYPDELIVQNGVPNNNVLYSTIELTPVDEKKIRDDYAARTNENADRIINHKWGVVGNPKNAQSINPNIPIQHGAPVHSNAVNPLHQIRIFGPPSGLVNDPVYSTMVAPIPMPQNVWSLPQVQRLPPNAAVGRYAPVGWNPQVLSLPNWKNAVQSLPPQMQQPRLRQPPQYPSLQSRQAQSWSHSLPKPSNFLESVIHERGEMPMREDASDGNVHQYVTPEGVRVIQYRGQNVPTRACIDASQLTADDFESDDDCASDTSV
jgi:hypothetical protein